MNDCRDERRWCCFHPREMVVGVCALCLNERLLVVAAASNQQSNYSSFTPKRVLPKIFALTNLLIARSDHKSEVYDHTATSSPTPEDSFISIKFEENGVASWDKGKISKISHDEQCDEMDKTKKTSRVIEHTKPHGSLRWRRRIGHLFQLIKRKRSDKGNVAHIGTKLEREKVKYGWIRILTKRRAKQ